MYNEEGHAVMRALFTSILQEIYGQSLKICYNKVIMPNFGE